MNIIPQNKENIEQTQNPQEKHKAEMFDFCRKIHSKWFELIDNGIIKEPCFSTYTLIHLMPEIKKLTWEASPYEFALFHKFIGSTPSKTLKFDTKDWVIAKYLFELYKKLLELEESNNI